MRNGQNKRMRGRNRKGHHHHNPLTRVYESNGPDVKIRGTANHVAEKYIQLARDAQGSGDPVAAENYYQHAEHYFRLIAAAQEQLRQSQPFYRQEGEQQQPRDDAFDDADEDAQPYSGEPHYPREQQQPYPPRDAQPYQQQQNRDQPREHYRDQQPREHRPHHEQRGQQQSNNDGDVGRLPSFITGGGQQAQSAGEQTAESHSQNGFDNQSERFSHRRRRRGGRGPRPDASGQSDGDDASPNAPGE